MWRLIILFLLVFFIVLFIYKLGKSVYLDKNQSVEHRDNSYNDFKNNREQFDDIIDVEIEDEDNNSKN